MTHAHTSHQKTRDPNERLLPRRELRKIVPVSDMTIWRWERAERFPSHISVNGRNYWLMSEVQSWIASRRGAEDGGQADD